MLKDKQTTKICPLCKNENLIRLPSLNKKVCPSCPKNNKKNYEIAWFIEEGEKRYY